MKIILNHSLTNSKIQKKSISIVKSTLVLFSFLAANLCFATEIQNTSTSKKYKAPEYVTYMKCATYINGLSPSVPALATVKEVYASETPIMSDEEGLIDSMKETFINQKLYQADFDNKVRPYGLFKSINIKPIATNDETWSFIFTSGVKSGENTSVFTTITQFIPKGLGFVPYHVILGTAFCDVTIQ